MNSLQLHRLRGAKSFNPNAEVPKEVCVWAAEQLVAEGAHKGCRMEVPAGSRGVGAAPQGCPGSFATASQVQLYPHAGPALSSGLCRFLLTFFPCSIIFWRTLVYTQCCGTILIQWGWVFVQRSNLWDSFWVLNNLYHYKNSIKKGLWYRLLTYFWYLFLQNDLFFCLKFYSTYSNYSQSIALEMKIKMDDDNSKRRYGTPNFHKAKRVNFLVPSKIKKSLLFYSNSDCSKRQGRRKTAGNGYNHLPILFNLLLWAFI